MERCAADNVLDAAELMVRMLSPLLIPGQPVPAVVLEPLGDAAGEYRSGGSDVSTVALNPFMFAGMAAWPGPESSRSERLEALTLTVLHELVHARQFRDGYDSGHDHSFGFMHIAQSWARKLGIHVPRDVEEAGQWPMNRFEHADGSARQVLDRARQAVRDRAGTSPSNAR